MFVFSFFQSYAQVEFNHSLGASLLVAQLQATDDYAAASSSGYAGTYSPRLNFLSLGDQLNLSAGTHLSLGFQGSVSSREGSSGAFLLDVPVVVELNWGHASCKDYDSNFGFFVGAGYEYFAAGSTDTGTGSVTGPVFDGGIRFMVKERSYSIRGSYMIGMGDTKVNVLGIGAMINFGM